VRPFSEGVAPVRFSDAWGVVGLAGQIVVRPIYGFVSRFSQGLALVKDQRGFGFIDKNRKEVIPLKYGLTDSDMAREAIPRLYGDGGPDRFVDGLARVWDKARAKGFYVDGNGTEYYDEP
jgi:hypothetical protein